MLVLFCKPEYIPAITFSRFFSKSEYIPAITCSLLSALKYLKKSVLCGEDCFLSYRKCDSTIAVMSPVLPIVKYIIQNKRKIAFRNFVTTCSARHTELCDYV